MSLSDHASSLAASLSSANLVPGPASVLIPANFAPTTKLDISFGDKAAELGTFFRASECAQTPRISFGPETGANVPADASYLFILTDPDAPTPDDPNSKPHRYLFLLYREPRGLALTKEDVGGEEFVQRRSFRPAEFAGRHGLRLVGVNWMTCAADGWAA